MRRSSPGPNPIVSNGSKWFEMVYHFLACFWTLRSAMHRPDSQPLYPLCNTFYTFCFLFHCSNAIKLQSLQYRPFAGQCNGRLIKLSWQTKQNLRTNLSFKNLGKQLKTVWKAGRLNRRWPATWLFFWNSSQFSRYFANISKIAPITTGL